MKCRRSSFNINGVDRFLLFDVENDTLADVLRRYGMTSVKIGCGSGVCGACSVILNGELVRSCVKKMKNVPEFSSIITLEGIGTPMQLHPIQKAFIQYGAIQCGFCTPGFIISTYALLTENPSPSREEVRQWFYDHKNICRCTGYKQIVDAVMAAAAVMRGDADESTLEYKPKENSTSIYGTDYPRPSALAKATGTCDYGADVGMKMPEESLHIAVVQPKVANHAKILSIDISEAEKMDGVVKIYLAKDVKGTNHLGSPIMHKHAKGSKGFDRVLLNDTKIYRYGDVVALVAADTERHARAAAAAVKVEVEELPAYMTVLDAVAPGALQIQESMPNTYLYQPLVLGNMEDTPKMIEESDNVVECHSYSSREPHLALEPDVCNAYYDEDEMITVQCKSQFLYLNLWSLPDAIGVPVEKLRFINNPVGGTFGYSMSCVPHAYAALVCEDLKKPVTLRFSWPEHHHYSGKRAPSYINARMGCDKEGKINALEFDIAIDHGAYSDNAQTLIERCVRFLGFPYNVKQATGLARMCASNVSFGAAYRGYGAPQCTTNMEAMMDMMAEKIGISPWEIRYRNVARPGDKMLGGAYYKQYPMVGLLEKAKPIYEEALARAKEADTPELRRGVGIVSGGYATTSGGGDSAGIKIEIRPDGSMCVYNTLQDMGQGGDICIMTHMLESFQEIGLTADKVHITNCDTKTSPNSGPSAGSRCHYMNGNAIKLISGKILDAMRKEDGTYRTYDEMVADGIPTTFEDVFDLSNYGLKKTNEDTGQGDSSPTYMYCVYVAEVEVDTATGKARCIGMHSVDDVGVVGNKLSCDGQGYGGLSHCIGFALQEDYSDMKKHGNMVGAGVPTILDIPDDKDFTLNHVENAREDGPYGSSGCSELYQSCGHMAVINAIYNACGVRIFELPATPEKIKAGLDKIANGEKPEAPKKYYLGPDLYETIEDLVAEAE